MTQRLTRRHWMLLAGSGLLAACTGTSQQLVVQQGLLPSGVAAAFAAQLARGTHGLAPGVACVAHRQPPSGAHRWLGDGQSAHGGSGWPQAALDGLMPLAQPLLPFGLPVGFGLGCWCCATAAICWRWRSGAGLVVVVGSKPAQASGAAS